MLRGFVARFYPCLSDAPIEFGLSAASAALIVRRPYDEARDAVESVAKAHGEVRWRHFRTVFAGSADGSDAPNPVDQAALRRKS
jgi:hypothetical protein